MLLAKEEEILKEWEYATSKQKNLVTKHTLTVTNKRVVSTAKSVRSVAQDEVLVNNIRSIHGSHETVSKAGPIAMIVFGCLLIVAAIVAAVKLAELAPAMGVVGLVIALPGVLLIVAGVVRLNQGAFTLVITTNNRGTDGLSLGAMRMFKNKHKSAKIKVKVENAIADEIIDSIGALLVENLD